MCSHMTVLSKSNYRLSVNENKNIADLISIYFNFEKDHYFVCKVQPYDNFFSLNTTTVLNIPNSRTINNLRNTNLLIKKGLNFSEP